MSKTIRKGTSVRNIELSDRASRALVRRGIHTLSDVLDRVDDTEDIIKSMHKGETNRAQLIKNDLQTLARALKQIERRSRPASRPPMAASA